jgi:uncharacterized zinc-type alcohol dehydrogenase-like protein
MAIAKGYAAATASAPLTPFTFDRREPNDDDVVIAIKHCGVCHSDIHMVDNGWGQSVYPIVPGHEITGVVTAVGSKVSRFKEGDRVGSAASSTAAPPAPPATWTASSTCPAWS